MLILYVPLLESKWLPRLEKLPRVFTPLQPVFKLSMSTWWSTPLSSCFWSTFHHFDVFFKTAWRVVHFRLFLNFNATFRFFRETASIWFREICREAICRTSFLNTPLKSRKSPAYLPRHYASIWLRQPSRLQFLPSKELCRPFSLRAHPAAVVRSHGARLVSPRQPFFQSKYLTKFKCIKALYLWNKYCLIQNNWSGCCWQLRPFLIVVAWNRASKLEDHFLDFSPELNVLLIWTQYNDGQSRNTKKRIKPSHCDTVVIGVRSDVMNSVMIWRQDKPAIL